MLVFGVGYWLLRFVTPVLGGVTVALIGKVADLVVLGVVAGAALVYGQVRMGRGSAGETSLAPTDGPADTANGQRSAHDRLPAMFWIAVVPVGLLDTGANVAYNVGITQGLTSVVVVLSSLFSAVTVLLAWAFLRERLAAWQWAGVLSILVGIALVNL
jgi:drug/metabolite transporter (DMT)-like permease